MPVSRRSSIGSPHIRPAGAHHSRRSSARPLRRTSEISIDDAEVDRLAFANTALEALPGAILRDYFRPVLRLRRVMVMRQKRTRERLLSGSDGKLSKAASDRRITEGLNALAKALATAAGEVLPDGTFPLNPAQLVECLRDKADLVTYTADDVLSYPCEPPETSFVYVILGGSVRMTSYQPQLRRTTGTVSKQYYTSIDEMLPLCGGGTNLTSTGAEVTEVGGEGMHNPSCGDAVSLSNVTSAVYRNLLRASRSAGQPTLQVTHVEAMKAPLVLGAAEALGLTPMKCVSYLAMSTVPTSTKEGTHFIEFTDVLRVRVLDVHLALVGLAEAEMETRRVNGGDQISAMCGGPPGRQAPRTIADYIAAARTETLHVHYPQNEILMRQSWLLQDTPVSTIRSLITRLHPRTYMPKEVLACPHINATAARQLCFLRRGRILVVESGQSRSLLEPLGPGHTPPCFCGRGASKVLEVVQAGASFGELSVLFGEARTYALVADTVCDVWCLPYKDFGQAMRRDDALRHCLVAKAAALRIRWLGEQRFTPALAKHLRQHCVMMSPFHDLVLRLIQERIEPVVFSPGSLVASTSERCGEMIFIIQGQVCSICDGVATYGPGDIVGESCLVAHRWPLGLAAHTMVEGWRLPRQKLVEALKKADELVGYSEVSFNLIPIVLKKVFQNPLPEIEVSGGIIRQRMPNIPPAPGGVSYRVYARRIAEVQLKALCYLYRDFVKWEDITYSTERSGSPHRREMVEALAREYALAKIQSNGENLESFPRLVAAIGQSNRSGTGGGVAKQHRATVGVGTAPITASSLDPKLPAVKKRPVVKLGGASRCSQKSGPCAFRVNSDVMVKPFTLHLADAPSIQPPKKDSVAIVLQNPASIPESASVRRAERLPPRLNRFMTTLAERDRALASQMRYEAAREKRLAAAATRPDSPDRESRENLVLDAGSVTGDRLPPVHRFLLAERPRTEITMSEALAIGYVLQLPDTLNVQVCVSFTDPDVTLGFPPHRGRRYRMATTPNDRFHKQNFLFAAATFDNAGKVDEQIKEKQLEEQMQRRKAQKLMTMMQSNATSARDPHQGVTNTVPLGRGAVPAAGALAREADQIQNEAMDSTSSILMQDSPPRTSGNGMSSLRNSPIRGATVKKEANFLNVLTKDPVKAMDALYSRHDVPWERAENQPSSTSASASAVKDEGSPASAEVFLQGSRSLSLVERMRDATGEAGKAQSLAVATTRDRWQSQLDSGLASPLAGGAGDPLQDEGNPLLVESYGLLGATGSSAADPALQERLVAPLEVDALAPDTSRSVTVTFSPQSLRPTARLKPADFMMPDLDYSSIFIRRVQRDVEGLNALAEEQRRECKRARQRERRLGPRAKDADAHLQHPNDDEVQVLENWAYAYDIVVRDPLQPVTVPRALTAYAGTDYLRRGITELGCTDEVPGESTHVAAWQKHLTSPMAQSASQDRPNVAMRVMAPVGTSQLGYDAVPLTNPAADLDGESYRAWVHQREEFFSAFKTLKNQSEAQLSTAHVIHSEEPTGALFE